MDETVINATDRKIISALRVDSRLSCRELGKIVNCSAATAMNHQKRLEKAGIIRKYSIHFDEEKLGFDIQVIIDIRVSKGKLFQVENKIAKLPNVVAVYDVTGDFDATVIAKFPNRRSMDTFIKKIQTYDFVERTHTKMILNTIKEDGLEIL